MRGTIGFMLLMIGAAGMDSNGKLVYVAMLSCLIGMVLIYQEQK